MHIKEHKNLGMHYKIMYDFTVDLDFEDNRLSLVCDKAIDISEL